MKRVLSIVPFENLYPPMNGGMLRATNLLHQLARNFKLTAIIHQDKEQFLRAAEDYPELIRCEIVSTKNQERIRDFFSFFPIRIQKALRFRYWKRSVKGPAEGDFLLIYPILKKLLINKQFDYILLEDMNLFSLIPLIRRYQSSVHIIYDAYNVNTRLAEAALKIGQIDSKTVDAIKNVESSLCFRIDSVFTCSELDLLQLGKMNNNCELKGTVIPNGVKIDETVHNNIVINTSPDNNILFCGSLDYLPNREGLIWFCQKVLPLILSKKPTSKLLVVGKGDPGMELENELKHPSIKYYGRVEKVVDYYKKAVVSIVPLFSGSGTRLKLLEAMGYGVAVVSTSIGAEGIDYTRDKDILIADNSEAFSEAIIKLLNDRNFAHSIALSAFKFAQDNYDWNKIGEKIRIYLQE